MVRSNGSAATRRLPKIDDGVHVERLEIQPPQRSTIKLQIAEVTPVIVHQWSEKAKRQMLADQQRDPKTAIKKKVREPKNPFEDFVGSLHILPGAKLPSGELKTGESWPYKPNTFGLPVAAFALGARATARFLGISKEVAQRAFFVVGELAPLKYEKLVMREDMVRLDCWPPKPDIRYRGMFVGWSTEIMVDFDEELTSAVQIVNLFSRAGDGGVCEWRPTAPKTPGPWGRYKVQP